jgi:hypothetical protein
MLQPEKGLPRLVNHLWFEVEPKILQCKIDYGEYGTGIGWILDFNAPNGRGVLSAARGDYHELHIWDGKFENDYEFIYYEISDNGPYRVRKFRERFEIGNLREIETLGDYWNMSFNKLIKELEAYLKKNKE